MKSAQFAVERFCIGGWARCGNRCPVIFGEVGQDQDLIPAPERRVEQREDDEQRCRNHKLQPLCRAFEKLELAGIALRTAGLLASAGNSFGPFDPAAKAAKAFVVVATPGSAISLR